MRKILWSALAVAIAFLTLTLARPALAADGPVHLKSDCAPVAAWYVNGDEDGSDEKQGDRKPTVTAEGLVFEKNQLAHHAASLSVDSLKPGTFTANPAPSLESFFSVEVINDSGSGGYATLRWNAHTEVWDMTTGGQTYSDADPAKLVKDHEKGTKVFSFGVGYVNTPNDGTKTTVTAVTFAGVKYDLTCEPPVKTTPPTTKPTSHPTTKPTASHTTAPGGAAGRGPGQPGSGALAITGPSSEAIFGIGGLVLAAGAGTLYMVRRRRTKFVA